MVYCLRDEANQLKYKDLGIIPACLTYSFFVLPGLNNEQLGSLFRYLPAVTSAAELVTADHTSYLPKQSVASGYGQINHQSDRKFKMHHIYTCFILDWTWCG